MAVFHASAATSDRADVMKMAMFRVRFFALSRSTFTRSGILWPPRPRTTVLFLFDRQE